MIFLYMYCIDGLVLSLVRVLCLCLRLVCLGLFESVWVCLGLGLMGMCVYGCVSVLAGMQTHANTYAHHANTHVMCAMMM